ncbi:MAG TPA: heavy metal transporter [Cyanothece sp. UBA12306]|nr:heavy metal transporter [Cyanothece sp. UBA12306]
MTITLKVPSIACEGCANTITEAIHSEKPEAKVSVNVSSKVVTVETEVSEEIIKNIIEGAGHTIEP